MITERALPEDRGVQIFLPSVLQVFFISKNFCVHADKPTEFKGWTDALSRCV